MFAYSSSKNRFMLTSIPLYKGDRLQYVLTWCRDLTNFSQLCDDLQSAIEKNKLISEELEFYRKMTTSQNMIGKCPQMIALMKTVEYVAGTDATVLITGSPAWARRFSPTRSTSAAAGRASPSSG
ncbi:hypothetical protein M5E87_10655 [Flavonifractor plautii]|nr:hypothetical protein M5E87_10655 [Flavonifractor plautii]